MTCGFKSSLLIDENYFGQQTRRLSVFFYTAILVVCFGFLADDDIKLLSTGNLANDGAVEGTVLSKDLYRQEQKTPLKE